MAGVSSQPAGMSFLPDRRSKRWGNVPSRSANAAVKIRVLSYETATDYHFRCASQCVLAMMLARRESARVV
jgi:hypothetical protein